MPPTDFVSRGQALLAAGNYQEAVKVCRLGLLGKPAEVGGRLILGQALMGLRRYDEVLAEMRAALEVDARMAAAHGLRGEALLRKGDVHAAREALLRARSMAPGDPSIAALLAETELAISSGGNRLPSAGDADPQTKHYPTHRGAKDPGAPRASAASSSFTRPTMVEDAPHAHPVLSERTGTVELDVEASGIEMVDDDLGDVIDPPSVSGVTGALSSDDLEELDEAEAEIDDADVLDEVRDPEPRARGKAKPAGATEDTVAGKRKPARPVSAFSDEESSVQLDALVGSLPGAGPPGAAIGGREPPLRAPAPTGPAAVPVRAAPVAAAAPAPRPAGGGRAAAPRATTPPNVDDMRMIRAGLGLDPDTRLPPPAEKPARGDDSTGIVVEARGPAARGDAGAGAGGSERAVPRAAPRTRKVATDPGGRSVARPRRRSTLSIVLWSVLGAAVIGGGVYGGYQIRRLKLEGEIEDFRRQARAAVEADTWRGWRRARDLYLGIAEADGSAVNRAALARARAVLAAEFGDDVEAARADVAALGDSALLDAVIARAHLAMLDGDAARLDAEARAAAALAAGSGDAEYLAGRAALLGERWDDAIAAFDRARATGGRPAYLLGLAAAHLGKRDWASARAALGLVLERAPGLPAAVIADARIAAARGAPGAEAAAAALDQVLAESERPVDDQALGVSPTQAAWAALVLAELSVARGDLPAARRALERARTATVADRAFTVAAVRVLLALGEVAAARTEVDEAVRTWPAAAAVHIAAAEVALAEGDAARALTALEPAGELGGRPEALALRGRASLARGAIDPAIADLDRALALVPDLELALVARAEIDLQAGNPRAAVGLLEKHYGERASLPLAITYAAALRGVGERDRARTVLAELTRDGVPAPAAGRAWLETARLERDQGDARAARAAYARAIELLPRGTEARLEAALLAIDGGDARGARESLDRLVTDAPDDGHVRVEAARAHVLTGDLDGAKALLEQAEASTGAPRWLVQRERGRLALRQRVLPVAIEALERAASLEPADGETRLLLIDAHLGADDGAAARRVLEDVMKRFAGRAEAQLAVGRVRLYFDVLAEAREAFVKAKDQLEREKAAPRWIAEAAYWLGRTTYYEGDPERARALVEQAVQLDPGLVDAHALLGMIDVERGSLKAAIKSWEKVTVLDPANTEAWFELGMAAAGARQKKTAKKALETFLQKAPTSELAAEARAALKKL